MTGGYKALLPRDEVLRRIADRHGRPDPFNWPGTDPAAESRFAGLVLHIISQQISTPVALTIFGRIRAASGGPPSPQDVLGLGPERMRHYGLSAAKTTSILQLARGVDVGALDLQHLDDLDDDSVVTLLDRLPGIGRWTAEMFLIHQLHRPDVLPAADLAIRRGVQQSWRLPTAPTEDHIRQLGHQWSPWRTYAAALLWASVSGPHRTPTAGLPVPTTQR